MSASQREFSVWVSSTGSRKKLRNETWVETTGCREVEGFTKDRGYLWFKGWGLIGNSTGIQMGVQLEVSDVLQGEQGCLYASLTYIYITFHKLTTLTFYSLKLKELSAVWYQSEYGGWMWNKKKGFTAKWFYISSSIVVVVSIGFVLISFL